MMRRSSFLLALSLLAAVPGHAQLRRAITQDDYDRWRTAQAPTIAPSGAWAAWTEVPQVGDGELVVRETRGARQVRVPRGYLGRPIVNLTATADSPFVAPPPQFTPDGALLAVLGYAPMADFERARKAKPRALPAPRSSLILVPLTGSSALQPVVVPRVRSVRVPRDGGHVIAYLLEPDSAVTRPASDTAARRQAGDSATRRARDFGTTLVIRNTETGAEARVADVNSYAVDPTGTFVAYTIVSRTPGRDGAMLRTVATGAETILLQGTANYKAITFDRDGRQVAFVSDKDEYSAPKPRYAAYHAVVGKGAPARRVVGPDAFAPRATLSDRQLSFTRDGSTLVLGAAPVLADTIPTDSLADRAQVDVWNYLEPRLQPQQKLEAGRERNRTWLAVHRLVAGTTRLIGSDTTTRVTLSDDGSVALVLSEQRYALARLWGDDGTDVALVDVATGTTRRIAEKVEFTAQLSPSGRFAVWFDKGHWFSHDIRSQKTVNVTSGARDVRFDQETWDTPSTAAPWGLGGWTTDDRMMLVYSRFDVWEVDPLGAKPARVLTDSAGVRSSTVLRVLDLEPEDRFIDATKPLLLSAFNERTKQSGFMRDRIGVVAAPETLLMEPAAWRVLGKAQRSDEMLLTRSTYRDFPDLRVGTSVSQTTQISDVNPQQKDVSWGTNELVEWQTVDGQTTQGILFKPEGFDPSKKYPMVTYFYESLSDGLHSYVAPGGRNTINPTVYTSLGYLVFFPDIVYKEGYPGQSAMQSIVPGIQMLIARGYVDAKHIGTAGQSWGGYQTAYMITQTNLFAAAFAGAPVANMTSAYGGIRWGSGLARAFQYEKSQSRIGGSIWQYPMRFIENSPLFYTDRIQTPVLIMSNDADDAVPWYQGIEWFVALKRFGKEAYLLNYNNDGHNPRKRANQKDVDRRMQEFFGHHLKGEAKPAWMRSGIPFLEKGRDQLGAQGASGAGRDSPR